MNFGDHLGPLVTFPEALVLPVTDPMNGAMRWFVDTFGWIFKATAWLFDWPILAAKAVLHALPWAAWLVLGVNQTTMASLSMVIIASIIGGTNDIGWEVLSTMRKAQFGESLLAGIVIALMAMVLDRISWGFAMRAQTTSARVATSLGAYAVVFVAAIVLSLVFPVPAEWPKAWVLNPAPAMNDALEWVFVE